MIDNKVAIPYTSSDDELESFVSVFEESAMSQGRALDETFLPEKDHPDRLEIATELVRVDLEMTRERGEPRTLEDYRRIVPELFDSQVHLVQAAYEDFRLRLDAGEKVAAEDYYSTYNLPAESWPVRPQTPVVETEQHPYPQVGDTFDGMPLESLLGTGVSSRVYLARQADFGNRLIALKVTPERTVEPHRLGRLQHTNIVPIYSLHKENGHSAIGMPFFGALTLADSLQAKKQYGNENGVSQGSTVKTRLDDTHAAPISSPEKEHALATEAEKLAGTVQGNLPWRHAAEMVAQLAEGLAHAHERGLIHSDIKPANILLGDDGIPRLLDFHLAAQQTESEKQTLVVGGTLPYMAPEHLEAVLHGHGLVPQSDIYSLGVILYQLVTGRLPFPERQGEFEAIALQMIQDRSSNTPAPQSINSQVPTGVASIIKKCLAPEVTHRYRNAAQLAEELRNELAGNALVHTPEDFLRGRLPKWLKQNQKLLLFGVAATFVLAVTTYAFQTWKKAEVFSAQTALHRFDEAILEARPRLCIPETNRDLRESGIGLATSALAEFHADDESDWQKQAPFRWLDAEEQLYVESRVEELHYLIENASIRLDPKNSEGPSSKKFSYSVPVSVTAMDLLMNQQFAEAAEKLKATVEEERSDATLWILLGNAQVALGDTESAQDSFAAATALQPASASAWQHRGSYKLDHNQPAQALADFDRAAECSLVCPSLELNRAIALLQLNRLKEAEQAVAAALELGAQQPRAWLLRAQIRDRQGNREGAKADIQTAQQKQPMDAADWGALAFAVQRDAPKQALSYLEQGLQKFPTSIMLLRNQVVLLGDASQAARRSPGRRARNTQDDAPTIPAHA